MRVHVFLAAGAFLVVVSEVLRVEYWGVEGDLLIMLGSVAVVFGVLGAVGTVRVLFGWHGGRRPAVVMRVLRWSEWSMLFLAELRVRVILLELAAE